jgi:hypothetical protein
VRLQNNDAAAIDAERLQGAGRPRVGTVGAKAALCVLLLAAGLVLLWLIQLLKQPRRPKLVRSSVYAPEPGHDKRIAVRGWTDLELDSILHEFGTLFREQLHEGYRVQVARETDGTFRLDFPDDIEPELYYFLLNALNHPPNHALEGRVATVLGRVALSPAFNPPDARLHGQRAWVYLPERDRGYELVMVGLLAGSVYEHDFIRHRWKLMMEARVPAPLRELMELPWPD